MDPRDPTEPSERGLPTTIDQGDVTPGERVGRYTVLERLGEGGMGSVWAALDPTLDRKVALKLLHPDSGGEDQLLREAQALAKLSHPNVVGVHEVDTHQGRVFMALELVQGKTLKEWLLDRPPWRDVLRALVEAGRGLTAAHAAGIVHRDVKPANILVGDDGRVRISDFGLARPASRRKPEPGQGPPPPTGEVSVDGRVAGTPGYMAPEQQRGFRVDARSDQFSFCVTAYEALCGVRPFPRVTPHAEVVEADSSAATQPSALPLVGRPAPLPHPAPGFRPPQRILRVLGRGLSADPNRRYPSMQALLDALERKARPVRPAFVAAAAAAVVAAVAVPVLSARARRESCAAGPALAARAWGPDHRQRLKAAFAGSEALERTAALLDGRAATWAAAYRDACEATRVHGGQSEAVLDLRLGCLEMRRHELAALVKVLEGADPALAARAADAVHALPGVEGCANVLALSLPLPPPSEPARRDAIDRLSERSAAVTAEMLAGRFSSALEILEPLLAEADQAQYAPLQARLWRTRGRLLNLAGRIDESLQSLGRAVVYAEQGRDDLERARTCAVLGHTLGYYRQQFDEGYRWLELGVATYQRSPSPEDEGEALNLWAGLLLLEEKPREALAVLERLERLVALSLPPDHILLYRVRQKRVGVLLSLDLPAQAIDSGREAVAHAIRLRGKGHPIVGSARLALSEALVEQGRYAEGHAELDQGEAIFRSTMGPDSLTVFQAQIARVRLDDLDGRTAAAVERGTQILEPLGKRVGPEHPDVALLLQNLGNALSRLGQRDEAVRALEEAVRILSKLPSRTASASARLSLARALWASRPDSRRALELARSVAADTAELGGRDHREATELLAAHR